MIDLHNHILYGLDDGAGNLEESIAIARQFQSEGVTTVAATPHYNSIGATHPPRTLVEERLQAVQSALEDADIDLRVVPGQEIFLTPEVTDLFSSGEIGPLNGSRTVLVELPFETRPIYAEDTLFRLELAGFKAIIAHPERYGYVQRDVSYVEALLGRGAVLQVTAGSLLGEYGPNVRRTAERLLRSGLYSIASSDRHHPGPQRSLAALHERIVALTDLETADLLLRDNPQRVLADRELIRPEVEPAERRSLFGRLRDQLP